MTLPTTHHQRHATQARHNEDLLNEKPFPDPCTQTSLKYKDWTATIAFYVALHYIQAYLHIKGFRTAFRSHRERNDYLKTVVSIRDRAIDQVLSRYIGLYKFSRSARYRPCFYHYVRLQDLCSHLNFALKDLPRILRLTP